VSTWLRPLAGAAAFANSVTLGDQTLGMVRVLDILVTIATRMVDHVSNELREHLARVVEILRPYAQSRGPFHNPQDVATAINLASISRITR
jgi:hypothetical protein